MKHFLPVFCVLGAILCASNASAVSAAGTVGNDGVARGVTIQAPTGNSQLRGNAGVAQAYKTNQRNTYFMVKQPDVDTACREKIYSCFAEYCGDVTVVPGQMTSKCQYVSQTDLYNYALLCLQKDHEILLPQYGVSTHGQPGGVNTAAVLCPSYIQQELMTYLSMANMASQLTKANSDLCIKRRQELEAAMSCHSIALAYGNETDSQLHAQLTDYCGAGIPGGSAEMVVRFSTAGNVGANVWGWAEKIVGLTGNKKGADWQIAVDAVLQGYVNRMNLACGDNMQVSATATSTLLTTASSPSALQTAATLMLANRNQDKTNTVDENPYANWPIYMEIDSMSDEIYTQDRAEQAVMAVLQQHATAQNPFFSPTVVASMHQGYERGTKIFIIHEGARCYMVPVVKMTADEHLMVAQQFPGCLNQ